MLGDEGNLLPDMIVPEVFHAETKYHVSRSGVSVVSDLRGCSMTSKLHPVMCSTELFVVSLRGVHVCVYVWSSHIARDRVRLPILLVVS